jgi:hypothetical protein
MPPVSARNLGRAGEDDAGDIGMRRESRTDGAVAGDQMQRGSRDARFVQQTNRFRRNQRRLLGRFCHHGIAGHQRRRHLAGKDRQRKIPRRDCDEYAAAAQLEFIALAGRSRHHLAEKQLAPFGGVVAAEIRGLTDFGKRIIERLSAFALQECDQARAPLLQQIRGALQDFRAASGRRSAPGQKSLARGSDCLAGMLRCWFDDASDRDARIDRADDRPRGPRFGLAVDQRRRRNRPGFRGDGREQRGQGHALAEFDTARILPLWPVELARRGDLRMPGVGGGTDDIGRAAQQRCNGLRIVGGERHERRIGAVLQ